MSEISVEDRALFDRFHEEYKKEYLQKVIREYTDAYKLLMPECARFSLGIDCV